MGVVILLSSHLLSLKDLSATSRAGVLDVRVPGAHDDCGVCDHLNNPVLLLDIARITKIVGGGLTSRDLQN